MVSVDMPELRIVDEELWQAAQDTAEARTMLPLGDHNRPRHLLSGLSTCGRSMIVIGRAGCTGHRKKGTCNVGRTIQRAERKKPVLSGIIDQLLEPDAISRLVKRCHNEMKAHRTDCGQGLAEINRRIVKADTAVQRLVAAIADGAADFAEIHQALSARKADREALRRGRDEIAAVPVLAMNSRIVEAYRKRARALTSHLSTATAPSAEVVERLRDLIAGVTLRHLNDHQWSIEVLSSLGSVVDLETRKPGSLEEPGSFANRSSTHPRPRKGSDRSMAVVAKEGLEPPTPGL